MIVCVWLINWPLQRLVHDRPHLAGRRVALFVKQRGLKVVAATDEEVVGLPLAEAHGFHVEPYEPEVDRVALEELASWCQRFSPSVAVEGTDCLLLDVTGLETWFQREQLERALQQRGFVARVGEGQTLGAAWARAHYDDPLPVEALRLPLPTLQLLHDLGIDTIDQLAGLPRDGVALRFPEALVRLDQFHGTRGEAFVRCATESAIHLEQTLEYPLEQREQIEAQLRRMIENLASRLANEQQGALRLDVTIGCQEGESAFHVGLYQATATADHLWGLTQLRLERLTLSGAVEKLAISVPQTARLQTRQRALFEDGHDRRQRLADFLDRTNCRVTLWQAQLLPDAQPEHAFCLQPFRQTAPSRGVARTGTGRRPLLVEPRPIPVEVTSVASGPPMQFHLQGQTQRTLRSWGPERIQTGWWRGRYIRRDYYRVETAQGLYWFFRCQGHWYLHGIFE